MKNKRSCFIASAAVMTIMMLVFYYYRMFPFGNNTLSWCDMNQQVIPFLMDFKDILSGKASLFLNLQNAGGMSFWGIFLFFISSPFTFIVMLVSKSDMYYFANILVVLKMMTCAFISSVFFSRQFQKLNVAQNIALSVMYAFCGYTMFYYQNQVWLDIMYLFPILLIGLIKLVEDNRVVLYILTFSAILMVNFYLSYMVAIFVVLSFGIYLITCAPRESRRKNILLLGISTMLVALITALAWLPSLVQYINSARTENIISSLKVGSLFTRFDTIVAVILCTGAISATIIMYLRLDIKHLKRTACAFYIFILMMIPIFLEPVNKMWHTGNYQCFPVRYGYIPIFFGLIILASVISVINDEPCINKTRFISLFVSMLAVSSLLIVSCVLIKKDSSIITAYTKTLWGNKDSFVLLLIFSMTAGLSYLIILLFYQYKQLSKTVFSVLLCSIVLVEALFNCRVYIVSPANDGSKYTSILNLSDQIKDNELYRVKTAQKYFDVNLIGSLGYNTLSHYTSLTNESFMYSMKKLGYSSYWMEVNSNGGTELTDAILGNRYSIIKSREIKITDNIVYKNSNYAIKQNSVTLPIGFVMNTDNIQLLEKLPMTSRLNIQQSLFQSVFNTNNQLFINYEPTKLDNIIIGKGKKTSLSFANKKSPGSITYNIHVKKAQTLYFDCFDQLSNSLTERINSSFKIYVNGAIVLADYPNQSSNGLVNLGTFSDQTVQVQIKLLKEVTARSFGLSGLHCDVLKAAANGAVPAQLKQVNNQIVGTVSARSKDSYLFLPLTYGDGYTVHVNNKETPTLCVFDSMIAIKLESGNNTVSIGYLPPGFKIGLYLSAAGVLLFIGYLFFLKKGLYFKLRFLEAPVACVFWLLFIGIFILVYIFPLVVYANFV